MKLTDKTLKRLDKFCSLITHGKHKYIMPNLIEALKQTDDGFMELVFAYLSDNYEDPKTEEIVVPEQYYIITSDNGAPDKKDFLCFMENLMRAHKVDFFFDRTAIDNKTALYCWLAETSEMVDRHLKTHYLVNFYTQSEDYHFTFVRKDDYEKIVKLYKQLSKAFEEKDDNRVVIIDYKFEDADKVYLNYYDSDYYLDDEEEDDDDDADDGIDYDIDDDDDDDLDDEDDDDRISYDYDDESDDEVIQAVTYDYFYLMKQSTAAGKNSLPPLLKRPKNDKHPASEISLAKGDRYRFNKDAREAILGLCGIIMHGNHEDITYQIVVSLSTACRTNDYSNYEFPLEAACYAMSGRLKGAESVPYQYYMLSIHENTPRDEFIKLFENLCRAHGVVLNGNYDLSQLDKKGNVAQWLAQLAMYFPPMTALMNFGFYSDHYHLAFVNLLHVGPVGNYFDTISERLTEYHNYSQIITVAYQGLDVWDDDDDDEDLDELFMR